MRKLSAVVRAKKTAPVKRRRNPTGQRQPPSAQPFQMVLLAASFAARKHRGQTRADNQTPYFSHVARVTLILTHVFGVQDEEILTAALLHDTLEDTATNYEELNGLFGKRVADAVMLLTKNENLPKKECEEDYVRRLRDAPEDVMIAKMADLYDNLMDRIHSPKLRKTASTAGRLLDEFAPRLDTPTGLAAHEKLSQLLEEVRSLKLVDSLPDPSAPAAD